jgi:hypothetical protein
VHTNKKFGSQTTSLQHGTSMAVMGKVEASIDPDAIVADWDVLLRVDRPLTRSWSALRDGQRLQDLRSRIGRGLSCCTSVEDMVTELSQYLCCTRGESLEQRQHQHQRRVVVGQVQIGSGERAAAGASSVHDAAGFQTEHL